MACFEAVPAQEGKSLTYRESGVDIDAGNKVVELSSLWLRQPAPGLVGGVSAVLAACSSLT